MAHTGKIIYVDMDGVIADFDEMMVRQCPEMTNPELTSEEKKLLIDRVCTEKPWVFSQLKPIECAIDCVSYLMQYFDIYFLSTPKYSIPESYTAKRVWLEKYFGREAKKKLILTHRKDLNLGDYLVDDRLKNGAGEFKGELIHFRTDPKFPHWYDVENYFLNKYDKIIRS